MMKLKTVPLRRVVSVGLVCSGLILMSTNTMANAGYTFKVVNKSGSNLQCKQTSTDTEYVLVPEGGLVLTPGRNGCTSGCNVLCQPLPIQGDASFPSVGPNPNDGNYEVNFQCFVSVQVI